MAIFGISTLAGICGVGIAYALTPVPKSPNKDTTYQGTTIYWDDGKTVMAKIGSSRTIVPLEQVSQPMRDAVLAAEDRNFYHESAISPTGIGRAVINNLSGGDTQGGSTITQQYVKNAYLNQQRTFTRKFKEMFIAIKIGNQLPKDQILERYLNTIFFGRDANGVEAAAQAYYGKSAKSLTVPEAAVLASNIKQPGYYDPRSKYSTKDNGQRYTDTVQRYNFVLQGMVKTGKLSDADYARYKDHPPMTKKPSGDTYAGQDGYLISRVKSALHSMRFTDTQISTGGLKVYTSWNKSLQNKAKEAVEGQLASHHMTKNYTRVGLVTIDATTGEVKAAYGGKDFIARSVDDAYYSTAQVGSTFKPFVLATAIQNGIGLRSMMDASAPANVDTNGDRVPVGTNGSFSYTNDEGDTNKVVDLVEATAESYNTVYVPLGFKADWHKVVQTAEAAGLPKDGLQAGTPGTGGFFLGQAVMRPLDLASGYATLANDGTFITPHSIRRVLVGDKTTKPDVKTSEAIPAPITHDVQYAMQAVVKYGTGRRAQLYGHEVAGKTGTTTGNKAAWFSGFTPKTTDGKQQLVTTVGMWRFRDADAQHNKPAASFLLQNVGGYARINGGDLPAMIWHDYMSAALNGRTTGAFAAPAYYGSPRMFATPRPTPSPTQTDMTPVCQPGQIPGIDHCKQDPNQNKDTKKICRRFPTLPQCQPTNSPNPGNTCRPPFGLNCSTPPSNSSPGGTVAQGKAARPLRE